MRALRVTVEAPVCSFRMPHFVVGRQLSFDMPPPSTIYGHVASAVGERPDPAGFRFAYWFSARARAEDLEHQHVLAPSGGRASLTVRGQKWSKSVEGSVQPVRRGFLFDAKLELYLDRPEWESAFRTPAFAVVLGRSQDLATIVGVDVLNLERSERFFLENTILPIAMRRRTSRGTTVLMPHYIGPAPRREPVFAQQIVLRGRLQFSGGVDEQLDGLHIDGEHLDAWVDPTTTGDDGVGRGLIFHSFMV